MFKLKSTLFFFLIVSLNSVSALNPGAKTGIEEHLKDVNKQWVKYFNEIELSNFDRSFTNDDQRIQLHLKLVEKILSARYVDHLSPSQRENRSTCLGYLRQYWQTGKFPINQFHSVRQPYFIDNLGTACAVGHLLIESGENELAEKISSESNFAYLHEMNYPEVLVWADKNGFTFDELAWIQPGYPPMEIWNSLGTGTDGPVSVMTVDESNNDLIVAGNFEIADGVSCNNVVSWNGTDFSNLGDGVLGIIHDAVMFNGNLYVGGSVSADGDPVPYDLAFWDGNEWTFEIVFAAKTYQVFSLHVHNGQLFATGEGLGFAGPTRYVAKKDGNDWTLIATTLSQDFNVLETFNGDLILGGKFNSIDGVPGSFSNIAKWDGNTWSTFGNGLDNTVRALHVFNGELYAGGDFFDANDSTTFALSKFNGIDWTQLINPEFYQSWTGESYFNSFASVQDEIYIGGKFNISPMVGTYGSNFGRLEESNGSYGIAAIVAFDSAVSDIAILHNRVYVGGSFTQANFLSQTNHVAYHELQLSGILNTHLGLNPNASPNPFTETSFIEIPLKDNQNISFAMYTVEGKIVETEFYVSSNGIEIKRNKLPAGAYFYSVLDTDGIIANGKLVAR